MTPQKAQLPTSFLKSFCHDLSRPSWPEAFWGIGITKLYKNVSHLGLFRSLVELGDLYVKSLVRYVDMCISSQYAADFWVQSTSKNNPAMHQTANPFCDFASSDSSSVSIWPELQGPNGAWPLSYCTQWPFSHVFFSLSFDTTVFVTRLSDVDLRGNLQSGLRTADFPWRVFCACLFPHEECIWEIYPSRCAMCMFVKLVFLNFRLIEDKFIQVHADESVQEKIASAPQLTRLVSHMAQSPYKFQIYSPSNKL